MVPRRGRRLAALAAGVLAGVLATGAPSPAAAGEPAAEPLPRAAAEAVGMSSERLARLTAALRGEVDRGQIPGAVVAVARRGRVVLFEAVGFLDREAGTPMSRDAIFAVASLTKPWAGAAALMLAEEGRLALGDPVERFLPQLGGRRVAVLTEEQRAGRGEGPIETVPARRPITIQDLLRHTSGLTYGGRGTTALHRMYPPSSNWAGANLAGEEFLARLAALPLHHQPGTAWEYGLGIDVAGLVVERTSGWSACSGPSAWRTAVSWSRRRRPAASPARRRWTLTRAASRRSRTARAPRGSSAAVAAGPRRRGTISASRRCCWTAVGWAMRGSSRREACAPWSRTSSRSGCAREWAGPSRTWRATASG
jgi:hypothetical protein